MILYSIMFLFSKIFLKETFESLASSTLFVFRELQSFCIHI